MRLRINNEIHPLSNVTAPLCNRYIAYRFGSYVVDLVHNLGNFPTRQFPADFYQEIYSSGIYYYLISIKFIKRAVKI